MCSDRTKSPDRFPSTHWTKIYVATNHEQEEGSRALAELLSRYRSALQEHLRKFFQSPEEREDCVSRFLEKKILKQRLLRRAHPEQGRFRNLLRCALESVAKDQLRAQNRKKRKPEGGVVAYEEAHEENARPTEACADPGDLAWARQVIDQARERTERFCRAKNRGVGWELFLEGFFLPLYEGSAAPPQEELARRHGLASAQEVSNTILTVKRRFGFVLRGVVREYEPTETGVEEEIRELMAIVSQGE